MQAGAAIVHVHLQPGQLAAGDARCRMHTLLGSCVSITLWHPARRFGVMSHYLLCTRDGAGTAALDARYGDEAMELMLRELALAGIDARHCEGKLFGAAAVLGARPGEASTDVGRRNGEHARRMLRAHRIRIAAECLFGAAPRRIVFDVASGNVWVRRPLRSAWPIPASARA